MSVITVTTTQEIEITPKQLAEWFCEMNSDEQAVFFNHCRDIFRTWDDPISQYRYIMHSDDLGSGEGFIQSLWEERIG